MREAASQAIGNAPSAMWGPLHISKPKGSERALHDIQRLHAPHLAAKQVEHENNMNGPFTQTVSHIAAQLTDGQPVLPDL